MSQLALPLQLDDHAVFESFLPAGNETVFAFLENMVAERRGPGGWLWGSSATGKTHLLQAVCARAGSDAVFVPLAELHSSGPDILEGLDSRSFVCLDDVQRVAGDEEWERSLFALANSLADADGILLCASNAAPAKSGFELPDLVSRMNRLTGFHLLPMSDEDRVQALQLRASFRGLELPDDAANYLIVRSRRDMASLYALLDTLDAESLRAQRRLTVPFVKKVLRFKSPG